MVKRGKFKCEANTPNGACQNPVKQAGKRCHLHVGASKAGRGQVAVANVSEAHTSSPIGAQVASGGSPTKLSEMQWGEQPVIHEGHFDNADGAGVRVNAAFTHTSWKGSNLAGAELNGPHVASVFDGSDMSGANLHDNDSGSFRDCKLERTVARRRSFVDTTMSGDADGSLWVRNDFSGSDLTGVDNLDKIHARENFYDDTTRFPAGYDPESNGWIKTSRDKSDTKRLQKMRQDAARGRFSPYPQN